MVAASDYGIVGTTVVAMVTMTMMMLVLSFKAPNYGAVLESGGLTLASDAWCDDLYIQNVRPFRFFVGKNGPFSCGWPTENTAFRATMAILGCLATGTRCWLLQRGHDIWLRPSAWLEIIMAACWLSVATLDADGLRAGNGLCRKGFKVQTSSQHVYLVSVDRDKLQCTPGGLAWLCVGDFAMLFLTLASAYVWYRFSAPDAEKLVALRDPFLAASEDADNPLVHAEAGAAPSTIDAFSGHDAPDWAYEPAPTTMH